MRVVFFSDSHLGLDLPARPRVERHRRGDDFFANFERVLDYAKSERVDLVLHGGDLFFRSRVPPFIVDRVYARCARFVEETGIPLGVIAGNHERSQLPSSLLLAHPKIHVFHRASTQLFRAPSSGGTIAVTGVPFVGDGARFANVVDGADVANADAHLLLAHEAFEGAVCGPNDFVFRARSDVVSLASIPDRFDLVVSGHIHRRQTLRREGRAPIVYAGSIERTSFAEIGEEKSFAVIDLFGSQRGHARFVRLPARPMFDFDAGDDVDALAAKLAQVPRDAIVRVTCTAAQLAQLHAHLHANRAQLPASTQVRVR
jgi:exonuclease SbcD